MMAQAREFIDFWIENSVHASEQSGEQGAEQNADTLAERCSEMAESLGISRTDLEAEVGDLVAYIGAKLKAANQSGKQSP